MGGVGSNSYAGLSHMVVFADLVRMIKLCIYVGRPWQMCPLECRLCDAREVVDVVTALSDTNTVEGTGFMEGWLTDDMDDGACDEATPEMTDGATLVASG